MNVNAGKKKKILRGPHSFGNYMAILLEQRRISRQHQELTIDPVFHFVCI